MKNDFLSVNEAKELTGKSDVTIRKIFKQASLEPDNELLLIREAHRGGHKLWLQKEYLLKALNMGTNLDPSLDTNQADNLLVNELKSQISYLKEQIVILQKDKESDKQRVDFLIKILGDKVEQDMKTKKLGHSLD